MTDSKTATDRLCEMLDERGISYEEFQRNNSYIFAFDYCDACGDYLSEIEVFGACICATKKYLTPEQAIAATLSDAPSAEWGRVITGLIAAHYDNDEERFKERAVQAAKMYDKAGKYQVAEYIIAQYCPAAAFIPM